MAKPSVGRIVHYREPDNARCRAAIVTFVYLNGLVDLTVFDKEEELHIDLVVQAETEQLADTWHWPERVEE